MNPRPTPPILAVPQSGPNSEVPCSAASAFRARSSAMSTLSENMTTGQPWWRSARASLAACSPGTLTSPTTRSGALRSAARVVGKVEIESDGALSGWLSSATPASRAAAADSASAASTAITMSSAPALSTSATTRPASLSDARFAGVPITTPTLSMPGIRRRSSPIRMSRTESWYVPWITRPKVVIAERFRVDTAWYSPRWRTPGWRP